MTVDTLYPFGQTLKYKFEASAPFTFYIRIPGWARSGSSLSINGQRALALSPDPRSSLQAVTVPQGKTLVELYLEMEIEVEERSNGSIAVHRGPLFYAVDLAYEDVLKPALRYARCLAFPEVGDTKENWCVGPRGRCASSATYQVSRKLTSNP